MSSLLDLEDQYGIKIIYAVEAGSRAWGYASGHSDYDVRFIYVQPVRGYLSLQTKKDVIEKKVNPQVELAGWDLKKALSLLYKSNPSILEWLTEENIYLEHDSLKKVRELSKQSFSAYKVLNHYVRMAKKNLNLPVEPYIKMKDYIQIIRPFLSSLWLLKLRTFPPNQIAAMMKELDLRESTRKDIEQLLSLKSQGKEQIDDKRYSNLVKQMKQELEEAEKNISMFADHAGDMEKYNEVFLEIIEDIWGTSWGRLTD
ncbi:nucleotidyltransferase domain-containing protein [Lysinibacillus sphaericus]